MNFEHLGVVLPVLFLESVTVILFKDDFFHLSSRAANAPSMELLKVASAQDIGVPRQLHEWLSNWGCC